MASHPPPRHRRHACAAQDGTPTVASMLPSCPRTPTATRRRQPQRLATGAADLAICSTETVISSVTQPADSAKPRLKVLQTAACLLCLRDRGCGICPAHDIIRLTITGDVDKPEVAS